MEETQQEPNDIDWGLGPLHEKMLTMLEYVHTFCTTHGIDYCLAYGSALGAMRHHGFIPWDDDVDLYMTVEGYARFRQLFQEQGDHATYYLQQKGEIDGMVNLPKLRMNGTTFLEKDYIDLDMHHGIYLDIFLLHQAPKQVYHRRRMLLASQYLTLKALSNRRYRRRKAYLPLLAFLRLFPKNFLRRRALQEVYRYDNGESSDFFDIDLRTYSRSFYSKDIIFPAVTTDFCGISLCVPAQLDAYLQMVYGEYRQVPKMDQIARAKHAAFWSATEDFRRYVCHAGNFLDESR